MLRIRKIVDGSSPLDHTAIAEVQSIMRRQFPGLPAVDSEKLLDQLENPFRYDFVAELFISEDQNGHVKAFALVLHDPALRFSFLDLISAAPGTSGRGQGAALYARVREAARQRGSEGLYFECLPDDPALSPDEKIRKQNAARLQFYERHGARPIAGTAYETPVTPGGTDSPYLVFDALGGGALPPVPHLRRIVRAILERKYSAICPPGYIDRVVGSIDPKTVRLRPFRYVAKGEPSRAPGGTGSVVLVVNDRHDIHHVRERGYVEAPVRIRSIIEELDKTPLFRKVEPRHFGDRHIRQVHEGALVDYIERACAEAPETKSVYPYVFPIRNPNRKPRERSVLAGYWCFDTFTPLNRNVWPAARRAVDCALTAADAVLRGSRFAYALVRPPGHHAERRAFGGFCYFNNAAIVANYLSAHGRVAVLDIDYHHGNGTQDIFYERSDVLTVSVHGHPSFAYPYFTGFADEIGRGPGTGFNLNLPLPETITTEEHRAAVRKALDRIERHDPRFLVLSIGFDTGAGDPTGTWPNRAADFAALGRMLGETGLPTVIVQEGGYRVRTLGTNARHFFLGLYDAVPRPRKAAARARPPRSPDLAALTWRREVNASDVDPVRRMVAATDMFTTAEVAIAAELVEERLSKGRASGYEFLMAEMDGRLVGYACFGETAGTEGTYDLYWIAVTPQAQRHGIGKAVLHRVEAEIAALKGRYIYVETSSTPKYEPTRKFYLRNGYRKAAEFTDFYRPDDAKVIYCKALDVADIARAAARPDASGGAHGR